MPDFLTGSLNLTVYQVWHTCNMAKNECKVFWSEEKITFDPVIYLLTSHTD